MLNNENWIVCEKDLNYLKPKKTTTFAFDTETFVYLDKEKIQTKELAEKLKHMEISEKRKRITTRVWSWQIYDEINGFFMTNDFYTFLYYICLIGGKFGWCYNAKFDFAQIDYILLCKDKHRWKLHEATREGKSQGWSYSSLHSDMGARYCFKLWLPYRRQGKEQNRHKRVHAVEFRDFMNIMPGGLARVLKSLDVTDNENNPVRKSTMEYQEVNTNNLKEEEIEYCCNDVKGLYFAIKKYNETLQEQSKGEDCIFGQGTNIMTAGGLAKRALLRELYPNLEPKKRIKQYQKQHPISIEQDSFMRKNGLYRGGICLVNPRYQGKLINKKMYRFDVNSEYPFAMSEIFDLIGKPLSKKFSEWNRMNKKEQQKYECILILKSVTGYLKPNKIAVWFNPQRKKYVDVIEQDDLHLMFLSEFNEMCEWYEINYSCDDVILFKRGKQIYRPFVEKYYDLKAKAKKEGNAGLTADAKLKLNSSYGKLAERIERGTGLYEENQETGAVHFIHGETEIDEKTQMSVAVGALITSTARVWILSHIREICPNVARDFIYIDTDSIHTFNNYDKADPYTLGGFKLEAICSACKYIAPKTYIDIEEIENGVVKKYECHTKGVNLTSITKDFGEYPTLEYIDNRFNYGQSFICLQAINVVGGKALIPIEKYLARDELRPNTSIYNYNGYIIESEI